MPEPYCCVAHMIVHDPRPLPFDAERWTIAEETEPTLRFTREINGLTDIEDADA